MVAAGCGAPDGIRRLVRAAPVVGDGPDNPRTRRRGRESGRGLRAGIGAGVGGGCRCGSGGSQGERRGRVAYPAGPRGTRLHGPGWWTRAGRPSRAGPGRPGTRRSLPGWLGAVRPGRPGEGEAAPALPGARPRGGAVGGPNTGAGIGISGGIKGR